MSIFSDVATFLATSGIGVFDPAGTTSTIFEHTMPDAPPSLTAIQVYAYGPTGPYLFDGTLPVYINPRVHITTRDADADTCYNRCYAAWQALIGVSETVWGGAHYFAVRSVHGPISLQRDANNLFLYAADVQCQRTI